MNAKMQSNYLRKVTVNVKRVRISLPRPSEFSKCMLQFKQSTERLRNFSLNNTLIGRRRKSHTEHKWHLPSIITANPQNPLYAQITEARIFEVKL